MNSPIAALLRLACSFGFSAITLTIVVTSASNCKHPASDVHHGADAGSRGDRRYRAARRRRGEESAVRALVKPEDTPTGRLRWAIADASRRFGANASRIGQAFATSRQLQHADIRALMAIIEGDTAGTPLTPGRLQHHVGLSSAGTSYVIDRLEKAGHIRRVRDHPTDHRVIHLHHTEL